MYVHESERVGKYESPSVGLDVKVFRPRCGLGSRGSVRMGGRLGARDANSLSFHRRAEPSLGPPCRDAVPHQDCEVFVFFTPSAEAHSAEPESSAPHLHQPSPHLSALTGPTPGAPATAPQALTCARVPRLLHACVFCTLPAQPVRSFSLSVRWFARLD